jgi:AcrR family transcriptional regulator
LDKRQQILEAALKLFVAYGFHGTPTSLISKEAGVANGTLFHYFATKDELVIALYVTIKSRMAVYLSEQAGEHNTFKDTFGEQYIAAVFWALDNPLEFRFTEQFKTSPFFAQIAPKELEDSLKPYYEMLQKGIDTGIIKPQPVDLLFTLISSQTSGLNQYLINRPVSKAKQHQIIRDTFEMLWAMIT